MFFPKFIPILIINSRLNQQRAANLLKKLKKVNFNRSQALGLVVEIQNHMPVQVDKILQEIESIKSKYNIPIYGFCHSHVSAESYYLLSASDRLYTMNTTIFELKRNTGNIQFDHFYKSALGISKFTCKSNQQLSGDNLDLITSANNSKYLNQKYSEINERLFQFSRANRLKSNSQLSICETLPSHLIGKQAKELNLVDDIGNYYEILKRLYPDCELRHVKLKEKVSTRNLEMILASPIVIVIFLIKVLIKYLIIMYFWIKHQDSPKTI